MKQAVAAIFLLSITLGIALASQNGQAKPLPIPKADAVDRIVISADPALLKDGKAVVSDAKRVERLFAFLTARNDNWETTPFTFPTPQWTIALEKDKDLVLVVWLGPGWMGGREGKGGASDNRLRTLSEKDRAQLFEILGVAKR